MEVKKEAAAVTHRKTRVGVVVSNKMDKTVIVKVSRLAEHPLYGKRIQRAKKYVANDPENTCRMGDEVRIRETRPLSKTKHWELADVIRRAPVFDAAVDTHEEV